MSESFEFEGTTNIESKVKTPMEEINIALKECKFGYFHIRLLVTAFIAIVANVLVGNTSAFLLPTAECDLHMNLVQKGLLNAIPYVGMLFSSMLAGFLTDTFGRKIFLVGGYGAMFLSTLVSASSQSYEVLLTSKFFEGLFFAAAFSPTVALTSEFCHPGIRDQIMLLQSSFIAVGQIVVAGISWLLLSQDWKWSYGDVFVLNTWNFYLYICSLWSFFACILYALLPESPKYLITQHRYDEARNVLIQVYKENTRKPADTYPCASLWKDLHRQVIDEGPEIPKTDFKHQLVAGLHNIKPIFRRPLAIQLVLLSSIGLLNMAMYNIIRLWFPQLSTIIEHSNLGSGNGTENLCTMLDTYTSELKIRDASPDTGVCIPRISGTDTYVNNIVLGTICTIPFLISGFIVKRVGKKILFICASLITAGCTFGVQWATTRPVVVALLSTNTALTQTMTSLLQTIVVEFFPTTTRALAISTIMFCGRVGTLLGNVGFPILLDFGCVVPFVSLTAVMLFMTGLSTILPTKK